MTTDENNMKHSVPWLGLLAEEDGEKVPCAQYRPFERRCHILWVNHVKDAKWPPLTKSASEVTPKFQPVR
jgi:hypothetical protein